MTEHVTKTMKKKRERRERAHLRVRSASAAPPSGRACRSTRACSYIYAQVIDDDRGHDARPGQLGRARRSSGAARAAAPRNKEAAKLVGEAVAERAKAKGIEKVVFDRGGYVYHGRVKALAEAAREKGLQF